MKRFQEAGHGPESHPGVQSSHCAMAPCHFTLSRLGPLLFLAAIVGVVVGGCAAGGDAAYRPVVRDSAGIVIVENPDAIRPEPGWRLDPAPILELGQADGEGPELFGRIGHLLRLRTGEIVVADGIALEIRLFDGDGRHLRTFGRRGEGPGEFISLSALGDFPGDSLAVVDGLNGRVSIFGRDGGFGRSFPLPRIAGGLAPNVAGWLRDGTLVVSALTTADRSRIAIYTVDREGQISEQFGEYLYSRLGKNGLGLAFGGTAELATADSLIWYGHSAHFELQSLDGVGSVRRIVRLESAPRAVTKDDIAESQETVRADLVRQGANPAVIQRILDTEYAATYPRHGRILVDLPGHLWVERYRNHLIPDDSPREWDIFDPEGRLLGSLVLPAGFQVAQIGEDFLLGVHADALGVQRVRLYGLERG